MFYITKIFLDKKIYILVFKKEIVLFVILNISYTNVKYT